MEAKEPPSTGTNAPHPLFLFSRFVRLFILFRFIYFCFLHHGKPIGETSREQKNRFPRPSLGDPQLTSHLCCTKRSNGAVPTG